REMTVPVHHAELVQDGPRPREEDGLGVPQDVEHLVEGTCALPRGIGGHRCRLAGARAAKKYQTGPPKVARVSRLSSVVFCAFPDGALDSHPASSSRVP